VGDATVTHFLCNSIQVQVHSLAVTPQRGKANEDYVAAAGCGHSTTRDANMKNYFIPLAAAYLAMSAVHAADPGVFIPGIVRGISMNTLVIARGVLIAHGHVRLDRLADFPESPISRGCSSALGNPDQ